MAGSGVLIIAEVGVNHNGDLDRALALIDAAAQAGADAVKFQAFTAEALATADAPKAGYQMRQTGTGQSQAEMLRALELGPAAFRRIAEHCAAKRIEFMATPFDEPSIDLLVSDLGVRVLKVSSGDLTNGPLLLTMARRGLPIILSTGMSVIGEIREALGVMAFGMTGGAKPSHAAFQEAFSSPEGRSVLREKVTLLHCTTEYPTQPRDVNLKAMDLIRGTFGLTVGYSDHTTGITVPIAAVARGAAVIEKHVTLDRSLPGPDHAASLEPHELAAMVVAIRETSESLGSAEKAPTPAEIETAKVARRSLHAACAVEPGERFTSENLAARRPGTGRSPMAYWDVLGTMAGRKYRTNDPID